MTEKPDSTDPVYPPPGTNTTGAPTPPPPSPQPADKPIEDVDAPPNTVSSVTVTATDVIPTEKK